jgi:hypothetical protein
MDPASTLGASLAYMGELNCVGMSETSVQSIEASLEEPTLGVYYVFHGDGHTV